MKIFVDSNSKIDFNNPKNGRKWLRLFVPHNEYGLLFKKKINLKSKYLGFSFKSNKYGLRGPSNESAPCVLMGTSFAMGLSVNNGENWYEYILNDRYWFNIGMPVGLKNQERLLRNIYKGDYKLLLFIYHPNIWATSKSFHDAENENKDIYEYQQWKVDYFSVLYLRMKYVIKKMIKFYKGEYVSAKFGKNKYFINCNYSFYDYEKNIEFLTQEIERCKGMFNDFEQVLIIRPPIKEQVYEMRSDVDKLKNLCSNYNSIWSLFVGSLSEMQNCFFVDLKGYFFEMNDFLPNDTHWSYSGNKKISDIIGDILKEAGYEKYLLQKG